MIHHQLKVAPEYFTEIYTGRKTFEYRFDNRHFAIGDIVRLHNFDPDADSYLNGHIDVKITYILQSYREFIPKGWVIFSFEVIDKSSTPPSI